MIDLTAAATATATVLIGVEDNQFDAPTPCGDLSVGEVVAHTGQLAMAFAAAAGKQFGPLTDTPPGTDGYHLDDDWRSLYPSNLEHLAHAWRNAEAWVGMTRAGSVDLPGEVAGLVALTEVVIHGWDVAVATGQPYDVDAETAAAVLEHVSAIAAGGPTEGLFGAAVPVDDDASEFERAIALSGRDPAWAPPTAN